jgi:hypothetical protein
MSDDLVTVATFADPVQANLAKNRLEASGVRAFLANEEAVDMDWLLGNALGWIRLEVGDEDADDARAVLDHHDGVDASAAVAPEEVPSAIDEAEPLPDPDQEEEDGEDFERTLTGRDQDAERAFRGAILGILFLPVQFYVFYLLVKVFISEEPIGDRERRRAIVAGVLCGFTLVGFYLFFRGL